MLHLKLLTMLELAGQRKLSLVVLQDMGELLLSWMGVCGLNRSEMAKRATVSTSTLRGWLRGTQQMNERHVARLIRMVRYTLSPSVLTEYLRGIYQRKEVSTFLMEPQLTLFEGAIKLTFFQRNAEGWCPCCEFRDFGSTIRYEAHIQGMEFQIEVRRGGGDHCSQWKVILPDGEVLEWFDSNRCPAD